MKKLLILLLLACASLALYPGNLTLVPFEYKDFGNTTLPSMDVDIVIDCQAATITQKVEHEGKPVEGAQSYLKQVQYSAPLMTSGSTDPDGIFVHKLPGNISFYTGLFTLTVEKSGYASKELHFEISGCFVNVSEPVTGNSTPPPSPGCNSHDDCFSNEICNTVLGECEKVSGTCGYAYDHQWFSYECCQDPDCGSGKQCDLVSHECEDAPVPNQTANETDSNLTANGTGDTEPDTGNGQPDTGNGEAPVCPLGFTGLVFCVLVVLAARE